MATVALRGLKEGFHCMSHFSVSESEEQVCEVGTLLYQRSTVITSGVTYGSISIMVAAYTHWAYNDGSTWNQCQFQHCDFGIRVDATLYARRFQLFENHVHFNGVFE